MPCVSLIVFVVALASAHVSSAEPRMMSLQLIDRAHLHREALRALRREVDEVWREELSFEWTSEPVDPLDPDRPERLYVVLSGKETARPRAGVIAAIVFLASGPRNQLCVYPAEAERLLIADPSSHYLQSPHRARNEALGRVLGRAIAHEIGHYTRNSTRHSPSGLMRAAHPIARMAGLDRSSFAAGKPAAVAEECSLGVMSYIGATPP